MVRNECIIPIDYTHFDYTTRTSHTWIYYCVLYWSDLLERYIVLRWIYVGIVDGQLIHAVVTTGNIYRFRYVITASLWRWEYERNWIFGHSWVSCQYDGSNTDRHSISMLHETNVALDWGRSNECFSCMFVV